MVVKTTINLPEGLSERAHKCGINVSGFLARCLKKEVERIEREDEK